MMALNFKKLHWVACESRRDMDARIPEHSVVVVLQLSDTNTWGYFRMAERRYLEIGYANVGLIPQAIVVGERVFVGINECLAGYDSATGVQLFSYRMPFLFHEFIEIGGPLIVRDEMGFVGITVAGKELWSFCTEGTIDSYAITSSHISGKTSDGVSFSFEMPSTAAKE